MEEHMRRVLAVTLIVIAILVGFAGCDLLARLLGGATVDLTVIINFTNENIVVTIRNVGSQSVVDVPFTVYLSADTQIFPDDHEVYSGFVNVGAGLSTPSTVATTEFDLGVATLRRRVNAYVVDDYGARR